MLGVLFVCFWRGGGGAVERRIGKEGEISSVRRRDQREEGGGKGGMEYGEGEKRGERDRERKRKRERERERERGRGEGGEGRGYIERYINEGGDTHTHIVRQTDRERGGGERKSKRQ